jgi:Uma2 family endonuclease
MPTRAKLTLDQYHKMIDAGILVDRKIEFIEGELIEMAPEKPIHSGSGNILFKRLYDNLRDRATVRFNSPITLSNSEPEPDIVVAKLRENEYIDHHPYSEDIYLVVEVSNSSLEYDLTEKSRIYARAGIPEYWVVDVQNKKIFLFSEIDELTNDNYKKVREVMQGSISPMIFPEVLIELIDIFR